MKLANAESACGRLWANDSDFSRVLSFYTNRTFSSRSQNCFHCFLVAWAIDSRKAAPFSLTLLLPRRNWHLPVAFHHFKLLSRQNAWKFGFWSKKKVWIFASVLRTNYVSECDLDNVQLEWHHCNSFAVMVESYFIKSFAVREEKHCHNSFAMRLERNWFSKRLESNCYHSFAVMLESNCY